MVGLCFLIPYFRSVQVISSVQWDTLEVMCVTSSLSIALPMWDPAGISVFSPCLCQQGYQHYYRYWLLHQPESLSEEDSEDVEASLAPWPWWILGLWKKSSRSHSCSLLHHNLTSPDWYSCFSFLFFWMYHDSFCHILYLFIMEFSVTHTKMLAPWGQGVLLLLFTNIFLMSGIGRDSLLNSINPGWMNVRTKLPHYTYEFRVLSEHWFKTRLNSCLSPV